MIKCNRCGNMNAAGAVRCQSCGGALSGMDMSGSGSNMVSQQQPALPAWLESLHIGERTSRPATNTPKFPTANSIEDGSLPSWMHAQRDETKNVTGANMPVSLRPSSHSAPSTDDATLPANSFAAQSLIDEQALPSWMQEGEIATPLHPEGEISPARLVDKDSMPDWMKSLQQQQSGSSGQGQSQKVANTANTVKKVETVLPPLSSPAAGLAAHDLIDQQSLPSWMAQLSNHNPATPASRERMTPPQLSSQAIGNELPSQPGQKGLAAQDLIDQQSLPSWMLPQKSGQNATSTNNRHGKQSKPPATGLPASSLLDMNALPSWLAENGQAQPYSQSRTPMLPSSQSWSPQEPTVQESGADVPGGRIAASSVIDMNALPEWLRSSGSQQSVPNTSSQSYSAPYAGSPRVENVRVPSRPRGEINSSETSEIAASVFTSMLGVALAAPGFPVSPQQQSGQLSYGEQMRLSGVSGMPVQPGMSITGIGNPGGVGMAGTQGGPGSHNMAGIPGGSGIHNMAGMQGGPGSHNMVGIPGGSGIHNMAGMQGGPGSHNMVGIPGGSGIYSMAGMQGGPGSQSMAGMQGGPGSQSMAGIPGGSGIHNMAGMQGSPGSQSITGIPGGSGIHNMAGMQGGPGSQSMAGIPGGSGIHNMAGMQGGPGSQSMAGIPGGSGIYSMAGMQGGPGSQSMVGQGRPGSQNMVGMQGGPGSQSMVGIPGGSGIYSMAGMQGGPGSQSMAGIPGGSGIHNMAGNPTGGLPGPSKPGMASEEKNTKKRGLFGALLDWLSR